MEIVTVIFWNETSGWGIGQTQTGVEIFLHRTKRNLSHGDFAIHNNDRLVGELGPSTGKKRRALLNFEPAPDKFPDSRQERDALLTEQVYSEILLPLAVKKS